MLKCILALFILIPPFASAQGQQPENTNIKHVEHRIDSILQSKLSTYNTLIDSTNRAQYIQQLEKANEIQNGNNTYYSVPIGILTAIITVLAVLFTFNYFSERRHFEKNLQSQKEVHLKILEDQRSEANAVIKGQSEDIRKMLFELHGLKTQNEKAIQDMIANAETRIKELTVEDKPNEKLNKLSEDVERLKTLSKSIGIKPGPNVIESILKGRNNDHNLVASGNCSHCGHTNTFNSITTRIDGDSYMLVCRACGTLNYFPLKMYK